MSILWLALQGKLGWYVHPRYALFGITMSLLALCALVVSAAVLGRQDSGADPHSHGTESAAAASPGGVDGGRPNATPGRGARIRRWGTAGTIAAVAAAAVVLLILPPATLTAQSMSHRPDTGELLGAASGEQDGVLAAASGAAGDEALGIRELSLLLRQQNSALLTGRSATISGFVVPDADDPDNVFVVTRFAITCCAVDAQPLGVPVLQPGWSKDLAEGEWVETSGVFTANPNSASSWPAVVLPSGVTPIEEPEDPYVG